LFGLLTVIPVFAQQPKFEIADVHVSPTARTFAQNFGGVLREGLYVNRDATMLNLIVAAYGVSDDNIAGGPGWITSDLFDVVAKVPAGATLANANLMLQNLLAERFHLVIRNDTRPVPRYVLTVSKNGSKLKSAGGTDSPGCQPVQQPGRTAGPPDPASIPNTKFACHSLTSQAIADNLHQMAGVYFDHDVIDSTKLEGSWDFELEWTPRAALAAKGAQGISVFDAVEKQLGLKVELQNTPMPATVIESVNRRPTPNPDGIATALAVAEARFEAATIKPADPSGPPMVGLLYTGGSQMKAGGTLRQLLALALQIPPNVAADVVIGLPKSADSVRWDITAKVPSTGEGAPNIARGRPTPPFSVGLEMLRGLLVDQFGLKFHTENREVTVSALTAGTGKRKIMQGSRLRAFRMQTESQCAEAVHQHPGDDRMHEYEHGRAGAEPSAAGECLYRSPHRGRHRSLRRVGFSDWLDAESGVRGLTASGSRSTGRRAGGGLDSQRHLGFRCGRKRAGAEVGETEAIHPGDCGRSRG